MKTDKTWYIALFIITAIVFLCLFFNKDWIESAQNLYKGDDWQNNRNFYEMNNISLGYAVDSQKAGNIDGAWVKIRFSGSYTCEITHHLGRIPSGAFCTMPDTMVQVWKHQVESWTSRRAYFMSNYDSAVIYALLF